MDIKEWDIKFLVSLEKERFIWQEFRYEGSPGLQI